MQTKVVYFDIPVIIQGLVIIPSYNASMVRLPYMEQELSSLLADIKIVHRSITNNIVMVNEYELRLDRILNILRRCQRDVDLQLKGKDLSALELVVER